MLQDGNDGLGVIRLPQKGKHEFGLDEMEGKKNLAPFFAFYGVHFHKRQVGIVVEKKAEVLIGSANPASLVHLELFFYLALGIADFPGHIDISGGEDIKVNEAVEGAFANHKGILVVGPNVIKGLTFFDERRNEVIQMAYLIFG